MKLLSRSSENYRKDKKQSQLTLLFVYIEG